MKFKNRFRFKNEWPVFGFVFGVDPNIREALIVFMFWSLEIDFDSYRNQRNAKASEEK